MVLKVVIVVAGIGSSRCGGCDGCSGCSGRGGCGGYGGRGSYGGCGGYGDHGGCGGCGGCGGYGECEAKDVPSQLLFKFRRHFKSVRIMAGQQSSFCSFYGLIYCLKERVSIVRKTKVRNHRRVANSPSAKFKYLRKR